MPSGSEILLRRGLQRAQRALQSQSNAKMLRERLFGSFSGDRLLLGAPRVPFGSFSSRDLGAAAFGKTAEAAWQAEARMLQTPSASLEVRMMAAGKNGAEEDGCVVQCDSCGLVRFTADSAASSAAALADCGLPSCPFGGSTVAVRREEQQQLAPRSTRLEALKQAVRRTNEERLFWRSMREEREKIRPQILGLAE